MAEAAGGGDGRVADYRYERAKRKNNPPAGLAAQGRIAERPAERYAYNPHLPPVLRFDPTGEADRYPELLEAARQRPLTEEEIELLAGALRTQEPWLEWSGKREAKGFAVEPVALHIHERVAAKAILAVAARQDVQRSLFADPQQEYREAVQFYQHDVEWANRLILGDSLQVMSSLAKRENLAGQVQMIYIDPPYGIRFASNFQPALRQLDVKDRPQDLTREPEVVKAYRDTWTLGIHTYLAYLRERIVTAWELLADSGSLFVQIGDENVHRVRGLLDEIFGAENVCAEITVVKTAGQSSGIIASVSDYILWYAKKRDQMKFRQVYRPKVQAIGDTGHYAWIDLPTGMRRALQPRERQDASEIPSGAHLYAPTSLISQGGSSAGSQSFDYAGKVYPCMAGNHWKTNRNGMMRLARANRIHVAKNSIRFVRMLEDFPAIPFTNVWDDTATGNFTEAKTYVVQTATKVIERCMLMTTDPGDLVLDPTCGSGTTAYVSEQWGRRWITIDTSRVATSLTRERLLTATFDYYRLNEDKLGSSMEFHYRSVPHITLKSIAQNDALESIFNKHEPILINLLSSLNASLIHVNSSTRDTLALKLTQKERSEGKNAITDADRRRWLLPKERWEEWEVPFDTDADWPRELQDALIAYRAAWRAKMDEVNATIAASAEQEELVDQPEVVKGVVRVSGPFTVESVLPAEGRLDLGEDGSPVDALDEELETFGDGDGGGDVRDEPQNAEAYLDKMVRLLRADGARFFDNKTVRFERLDPLLAEVLHAEGEWSIGEGEARRVAVSFGPQYGDVTARQVEICLRAASRRGYDDLVFAGFNFDAEAQATIQEDPNPVVRAHLAQIRPDVNMGDLLKTTPNSQIFTILGLPRTRLDATGEGEWTVTMEGVDVYDPVDNSLQATGAEKVAAWFVDSDYDGRTFCICQAFFPDKSAWEKLARALKGVIEPEAFARLSGTTSLPFRTGEHGKVAVKVIDPRGNEVMRVHALGGERVYA